MVKINSSNSDYTGSCLDSSLEMFQNKESMELSGWNVDLKTERTSYPTKCVNSTMWDNSASGSSITTLKSIDAIFQGSGIARLDIGHCGSSSFVQASLNNKVIAEATKDEKSVRINFYYEPKDALKISSPTYNNYMIINSLHILCGGKYWYFCDFRNHGLG